MSRRYGRNQKRRAREEAARLALMLGVQIPHNGDPFSGVACQAPSERC